MNEGKILLPGEVDEEGEETPPILWDPRPQREITETTLADAHAPKSEFNKQLHEGAQDLGEGFLLHDAPALIERGADGGIVKITPLDELPGVHFERGQMVQDDAPPVEGRARPTPVPLSRESRRKLVEILAKRLYDNYATEASLRNRAKYNPIRDGLHEPPAGSPEYIQPKPGTPFYYASEGEVFEWLKGFIAARVQVIDKKKFGGGHLADLALHIE